MNDEQLQAAQLRMLDFIEAIQMTIDDGYDMLVELQRIGEWVEANQGKDIAQHPRYVELVGRACTNCFGRLEKRTNGHWCAACERMQ